MLLSLTGDLGVHTRIRKTINKQSVVETDFC